MREISSEQIVDLVTLLCQEGNFFIPGDVKKALEKAREMEESPLGKNIISRILENAEIAAEKRIALCQDTGFAVFFVELGQKVTITGDSVEEAINEGVRRGYQKGFLRASIVSEPCGCRKNTGDNTPSVIHLKSVPGSKLKITFAPKGGGSENSIRLKMMSPNDCAKQVESFVLQCVQEIGSRACPPLIVGIGIGGNAEEAVLMAKEGAALRPVGPFDSTQGRRGEAQPHLNNLENKIFNSVNNTGIGPQGLGGTVTALAVHIAEKPTHIATLPVAVNLQCHCLRRRSVTI